MLIEIDEAAKKEKFLKRLGRLNPLPTNEQETSRKNIFQICGIFFTLKLVQEFLLLISPFTKLRTTEIRYENFH